jgi:hypothetical protein
MGFFTCAKEASTSVAEKNKKSNKERRVVFIRFQVRIKIHLYFCIVKSIFNGIYTLAAPNLCKQLFFYQLVFKPFRKGVAWIKNKFLVIEG